MKLTGDPIPVAQRVGNGPQHGHFSVTASGVLAYRANQESQIQLTWMSRQGGVSSRIAGPRAALVLALSPDESQVALFRSDTGTIRTGDLWLLDLAHDIETRFTFGQSATIGGFPRRPVWSPDGKQIAYLARGITAKLSAKPSNGAGNPQPLLERVVNCRASAP